MFVIRELVPSDLVTMLAINEENVPALGSETLDTMTQLLAWSALALGVEVEQNLVGFCLILHPGLPYSSSNYTWFCARYSDFIYLDRVAFVAEFQGQGFGSALYNEVESRSQAPVFLLEVNIKPRNEGSLRFHAKQGFAEVGQQVSSSGKLVSLMAKSL